MGQKVNPHGLRVGIIKDWSSKWYAEGDFADNLVEDYNIRKFLKTRLYAAGVCTSGWDGEVYGNGTCQGAALWAGRTAAKHIVANLL